MKKLLKTICIFVLVLATTFSFAGCQASLGSFEGEWKAVKMEVKTMYWTDDLRDEVDQEIYENNIYRGGSFDLEIKADGKATGSYQRGGSGYGFSTIDSWEKTGANTIVLHTNTGGQLTFEMTARNTIVHTQKNTTTMENLYGTIEITYVLERQ